MLKPKCKDDWELIESALKNILHTYKCSEFEELCCQKIKVPYILIAENNNDMIV